MASTRYKPAGIPTLTPHDAPEGDCVLARLLAEEPHRATLRWPPGFEGGIVHRLDTSTSGAVWVADDPEELASLRDIFAEGKLDKVYRFRTAQRVPWDKNQVTLAIGHHPRRRDRMVVKRGEQTPVRGRWYPALTAFRRLDGELWEARIRTGVMHQIRVHAAFVGLALTGDRLYGGAPTPHDAPEGTRFFLHHVGLRAPGSLFTAPVPLPAWARLPGEPEQLSAKEVR